MAKSAVDRRTALKGGLALATAALALGPPRRAAAAVAPITIVINQSPWYDGFRKLVEIYEKETGNKVALDVNPFGAMLEKQRNSVHASQGQFDLLPLNGPYFPEFYHGGFLQPLTDIDPGFRLDPAILTFDDSVYWDEKTKTTNAKTGKLVTVPINPNVSLLYYRTDLYEKAGLKVPETWDELYANAKALQNPPQMYGMLQRGARGNGDVTFDWFPYLFSFGGSVFKDEKSGDFTVTINSPAAKQALDFCQKLNRDAGHPAIGGQAFAPVVQNVLTGKGANALMVVAAWSQMDDPSKSAVAGKIGFAVTPHAPGFKPGPPLGHFLGGIPKNVPKERQQAALAFLKWFQTADAQRKYAEAGAPPVRLDVLRSDLSARPEGRWMRPLADSLGYARQMWTVPEGQEIVTVLDLRLNQVLIGELGSAAALNKAAEEIHAIMQKAGYKTGRIADLS
jgi:multiple sugar transport system substrate-binding protein